MKGARQSIPDWLWVALPIGGVFAVFFACVLHEPLWGTLGIFHMGPYFADLSVILAANDAKLAGVDPYLPATGFDFLGRPHVYGPIWLELHRFGLTRSDTIWLGGALVATSVAAGALWCRPRGPLAALACLALLASPGALLAYERANNDLVVLLLLLVAALAMLRPTWARVFAAVVPLVLASLLKFYPLIAIPMLAIKSKRWRALVCGITALGLIVVMVLIQLRDMHRAIENMPASVNPVGYGAVMLSYLWAHPGVPRGFLCFGFLTGVCFWPWFAWRENRNPIPLGDMAAGFVAGALAWGFCFFATGNYSYRAVLFILPAGVWLAAAQAANGQAGRNAWLAVSGLTVTLWLASLHEWMNQAVSVNEWRATGFLLGVENGLCWGLSLYLLWVAVREGLASWRDSSWSEAENKK